MSPLDWFTGLSERRKSVVKYATFLVLLGIPFLIESSNGISLSSPRGSFALTILELVALLLPAIAIVLQASLRYADHPYLKVAGMSADIRESAFWAAALSGFLLYYAVYVLMILLQIPIGLRFILMLVSLTIPITMYVPIQSYLSLRLAGRKRNTQLVDTHSELNRFFEIGDRTDEELELMMHGAGIDESEKDSILEIRDELRELNNNPDEEADPPEQQA